MKKRVRAKTGFSVRGISFAMGEEREVELDALPPSVVEQHLEILEGAKSEKTAKRARGKKEKAVKPRAENMMEE